MQKKLIIVLIFAFLTACGGGDARVQPTLTESASKPADVASGSDRGGGGGGGSKDSSSDLSLDQADKSQPIERKIIRNADLQLEAASPEEAQQKITSIAESKQGFVVESTQSSSSSEIKTRDVVTLSIRVPAEKFNESLDEIRKTSNRVITEIVKGQDVTEEYVDIEARLKTKKALEAQFLEIMKQGKTVEDALNVQRELSEVRGEIERIEGRKRFLESQTSLSTINIRIQSSTTLASNPSGFFYQLKDSFSKGFDVALGFISFFVTLIVALLPFLILVVLPSYFIARYFIRKNKKEKSAKDIVAEEIKNN